MSRDAFNQSISSLLRGLITRRRNYGGDIRHARVEPPSTELRPTVADADQPEDKLSQLLAPGTLIARKYVVERVLGVGGMGVVIAARHIQLEQRIAIKFLRKKEGSGAGANERFLREARAAATLSSEHVARVLDVGTLDSGEPFMVMEYLDGTDLAHVLDRGGPMAIAEAVGSVLQVCEAIAEAHSLGIVHRDLKPANLFLSNRRDRTKIVKVLDFGISKSVSFNTAKSNRELTGSGLVMGSPSYMSPEQIRNARVVDARTDLWALGVILYELITGVRPFRGETAGETFARIISEKPLSVCKHRSDVPEGLATVIAKCLETSVDRRIQSIAELASELLPYAPEAGSLVERALRWSAVRPVAALEGSETSKPSVRPTAHEGAMDHSPRPETGPTWLKSGVASPTQLPIHWRPRIAAGMASIATAGVLAGAIALGGRTRPNEIAPESSTPLATSFRPTIADAGRASLSMDLPKTESLDAARASSTAEAQTVEKQTAPMMTVAPPRTMPKPSRVSHPPPASSMQRSQREIL